MKHLFIILLFCAVAHCQDWSIKQVADPFRGTSFTQFMLEGKYLTPPATSSDHAPMLLLRCSAQAHGPKSYRFEGKLLAAFLFLGDQAVVDAQVGFGDGTSRVMTQWRLDDGKIQSDFLSHSTNFKAISLPELLVDDFFYAHQLPHKESTNSQVKKVVVSIPEYLGSDVVIQFDLPDVTEVAKTCGVTYHKN
jgi:hypothetical protein